MCAELQKEELFEVILSESKILNREQAIFTRGKKYSAQALFEDVVPILPYPRSW